MKVPNFGEAHCGEGAWQSMQWRFGGRDWRVVSCIVTSQRVVIEGERERRVDRPWIWILGRLPSEEASWDRT